MSSLSLLLLSKPEWVKVSNQSRTHIEFKATPVLPSGLPGRTYALKLATSIRDGVTVNENPKGSLLPSFCLERHINLDGSFCVFLNSTAPIKDQSQGAAWWAGLNRYLNCQDYAERKRQWPIDSGLCHGDAAHEQIAIEEIAEPLGWLREIRRGIFRKDGWLATDLPRLTKDTQRPVTKRSSCPRGCKRIHGEKRNVCSTLSECGRNCLKSHPNIVRANCPHRKELEEIIVLEHKRLKAEDKFLKAIERRKLKCCKTMDNCPLSRS